MVMPSGGGPAAAGPQPAGAPVSRRRLLTILGAGAAAGVAAGGIAGALYSSRRGTAAGWELQPLPTAALLEVEGTIAPAQKARLLEEARRCREPLARVAIWHSPATPGGTIGILAGMYRSPPFRLTATPSLVAIPYPAPYQTGRGTLTILGEANDFGIALSPRYMIDHIDGTWTIRVWWTPVGGCP